MKFGTYHIFKQYTYIMLNLHCPYSQNRAGNFLAILGRGPRTFRLGKLVHKPLNLEICYSVQLRHLLSIKKQI